MRSVRADTGCVAVVPAYMAEDTVADSVEALLVDNAADLDSVIVITSPGDGGTELVARMQRRHPRLRLIASDHRLSAGAARNLGRQAAPDASLLLFVDADCSPAPGCVARLRSALADRDVAAAAAVVEGRGAGACGWLRHVLEFKEAAGHGRPPGGWVPPSATLLCRASSFDAVGGFADMWPGEDLLLCWRLRDRGEEVVLEESARSIHQHPRGWLRMLAHQYRLGRTSARARRIHSALSPGDRRVSRVEGSFFLRRPWAWPLLAAGRACRGVIWFSRYRRRELPLLVLVSPLYLFALAVWAFGFYRGASDPESAAACRFDATGREAAEDLG